MRNIQTKIITRAGDFVITHKLYSSWNIDPKSIFRTHTGIIFARMYHLMVYDTRIPSNTQAVLIIYPDKTKHFIKGADVDTVYKEIIMRNVERQIQLNDEKTKPHKQID